MTYTLDKHLSDHERLYYRELTLRWGRIFASFNLDDRGFGLDIAERCTSRFVNFFVDKPTGEISLRVSYKKE